MSAKYFRSLDITAVLMGLGLFAFVGGILLALTTDFAYAAVVAVAAVFILIAGLTIISLAIIYRE